MKIRNLVFSGILSLILLNTGCNNKNTENVALENKDKVVIIETEHKEIHKEDNKIKFSSLEFDTKGKAVIGGQLVGQCRNYEEGNITENSSLIIEKTDYFPGIDNVYLVHMENNNIIIPIEDSAYILVDDGKIYMLNQFNRMVADLSEDQLKDINKSYFKEASDLIYIKNYKRKTSTVNSDINQSIFAKNNYEIYKETLNEILIGSCKTIVWDKDLGPVEIIAYVGAGRDQMNWVAEDSPKFNKVKEEEDSDLSIYGFDDDVAY